MKRKKQGAGLITVVIAFMFVFTVATAMLSMVASNYKARVVESKRIENLYASDSGLDVAYNIIGKTFDAATKYANLKVQKMQSLTETSTDDGTSIYNQDYIEIEKDIATLSNWNTNHPDQQKTQSELTRLKNEDKNLQEILCNEEFKRAFKNFIAAPVSQSELGEHESPPDKLRQSIDGYGDPKRPGYVSEVKLNTNTNDIDFTDEKVNFGMQNNKSPELTAEVGELTKISNDDPPLAISNDHSTSVKNLRIIRTGQEAYNNLTVTSVFYSEKKGEKEINKRQLKAAYKIIVPNYKDIYFQSANEGLNDLATKDRALTIYGDMKVNHVNELTVNGEVFVQGSPDTDEISKDRVYGKYFGGITVTNSDEVKFEKNVITRGTFNVQTPTIKEDDEIRKTRIYESLYAKNIYVGNINGAEIPKQNSRLTIKNGIINNDLTLNANNAEITINNLYGINDIDLSKKAESSSSIIVNGDSSSNSSIKISDSVYLMGTAHIAATNERGEDYQTAESGAVKGNYIAYAIPLNEAEKFAYYDPLQLLEPSLYTTGSALTVKKNHFIDYWNESSRNPSTGAITWPENNIYSIGVIVCEKTDENGEKRNEVIQGKSTEDSEVNGTVNSKREEFAKYDYKFGQDASLSDYTNSNITSFDSLIDTNKIPSKYNLTDGEYAIFNGSTSKEIKITKSANNDTSIDSTTDSSVINIRVGHNKDLNAIIATAGKVSIESGVTINGCIIAKGDLDINGSNVNINYDPDVIERVQSRNFNDFKYIFGENVDITSTTGGSASDANGSANYDLKNFLESKLWKMIN
ncbi:hypothetical protein D2A34_01765 [Clostridium chromiireducens]|uniref:DUF2572 family protein n=1 Tax=Clostridium chromiireducens TaxID=225345 RepID=A0A399IZG0_9CLOT|nr:hypothetical protein [Clostridium chromiireducens]RII36126.1 hypothetical protein D2A34_01765 [Clostridium chromiireducens]